MNHARIGIVAEQLRRPVPGGIGAYVRGLAQGLRELDQPDIALIASGTSAEPDPLAPLGFPVYSTTVPPRILTRLWDRGLGPRPVGFDLVHAASFALPPAATPLTVTVHDTAWLDHPEAYPRRGRRWHDAALKRALTTADALFTPSPATADVLRERGASSDRVFLIDEGVDHLPAPDHEAAARRLGELSVNGPFLLAVGTIEPRKNLPRLLAAYADARASLPEPWPLVVVGPEGWGAALPEVDGVILVGSVPTAELVSLYSECRAFVSVPLSEGFGLPAVEAMASGAPVISSPVPSTKGAAYEVDPLDVDAIAAAIVGVATNAELRAHLQLQGAARAAQLTWRAVAVQHLAVWQQLLD